MDLFKIGSNIASMQALNSLYKLNSKLSVHQERLSTGKRVNSAQDDTAAFSVAKNVETTKQGHERALQRVKNAQSILSIIEAGQQKQLKLLQSMKNKIIQAQDKTLNTAQRQSILDAVDQVRSEIEDIGYGIHFNGNQLVTLWNYLDNDYYTNPITFRVGSGTSSSDTFAVTATILSSPSAEMPIASSSATPSSADITMAQNNIENLSSYISNTGSAIERLKHKEDMIRSQITANETVRSNYEDADFAKEQMELLKVQILQQTATAALAQANSAPQSVLSLFR